MSKILILGMACLWSAALSAQFTASGVITDCETNEPIENVLVEIPDSEQKTFTDKSGRFSFENLAPDIYRFHILYTGYEEEDYEVEIHKDQTDLSVSLCKVFVEIPVVITATRTERKLKDVPVTTQVITSEAIEKSQSAGFRDFLEQELPGVEFSNNGGYANINMMGFGGKYILFLIDGERMAGETFDNADYGRIDLSNIERVEIVKGASSSLYGSNAIGGVINIITKKPKKPFQISAGALYGSEKDQKYNLFAGTKQKWGSLSLSSFYKSKEPYLLEDTSPLMQEYEEGTVSELPLRKTYIAGYIDYGINPKVSFTITPEIQLELNSGYYFKERNSGGLDGYKVRGHYYDYTAAMKSTFRLGKDKNLVLSGSYDRYDKYDYYKLLEEKDKNYENQHWNAGALYDQKLFEKHLLTAGGEIFSENLLTFMFDSEGGNERRQAQNYSIFVQQEWELLPKITLVSGARYDHHSRYKSNLSLRLSAMYKPAKKVTLRGGYAGGFRSPTLKELYTNWFHPYGGGFQILGNRDLKAEKSHNFNLSSDFSFKKLNITVMGQYSQIKGKINTVWLSNDTIQYVNVGKADILSGEISLAYRWKRSLQLKGSATLVYENPEKQSVTRPYILTFRADYTPSFIRKFSPTISLSGKYFSSMNIYGTIDLTETDNTTGVDELTEEYKIYYEPYSIWRLQLSVPLPFDFTFSAGINNLFDYKADFSSFYSSVSPGRTYYLGLKWTLE